MSTEPRSNQGESSIEISFCGEDRFNPAPISITYARTKRAAQSVASFIGTADLPWLILPRPF